MVGGARHEITFSYFDEKSGTYSEVTIPGNVSYADVTLAFERFIRSLGYMELTRPHAVVAQPSVDLTGLLRDFQGWTGKP